MKKQHIFIHAGSPGTLCGQKERDGIIYNTGKEVTCKKCISKVSRKEKGPTHLDILTNQKFTPTAVNEFGDVRHTGVHKKDGAWWKKGTKFETWLTKDSFRLI